MIGMKDVYKVDLARIEGTGDFPCPVCGVILSPDDVNEESYKVLEVKAVDDIPDKVLIQCNRCQTKISMVGFDALEEKPEQEPTKPKPLKGKIDEQILQLLEDGSSLTLDELAEELDKEPKVVYKALRKLFEKDSISNDPTKARAYMLAKE